MMLLADIMVLYGRSVSCSSLFLMIANADDTGTAVKSDIIRCDTLPLFQLDVSYFIYQFFCVIDMVDGLANKGFENSS